MGNRREECRTPCVENIRRFMRFSPRSLRLCGESRGMLRLLQCFEQRGAVHFYFVRAHSFDLLQRIGIGGH